jgi:thymidylate synthase
MPIIIKLTSYEKVFYGENMKEYNEALKFILENGVKSEDRTGEGTLSYFGYQMRFDLQKGFPAVTTKKLAWKSVVSELVWFLEGSGDERRLAEILYGTRDKSKKTIWTDNANASYWKPNAKYEGDLGRVYGVQWRSWLTGKKKWISSDESIDESIDQIAQLIHDLKNNPYSRRHILTAWNVAELNSLALPPCHTFAQFYVRNGKLSCQMYQRSADFFLGVPFNIASYSLLTHMIAQVCDLEVGEFVHTFGDAHIYLNHIDAVKEQLQREPYELPTLKINKNVKDIDGFKMEDFELVNYKHHPTIKAPMAV